MTLAATWKPLDEEGNAELLVNGKRITTFPSYPAAEEAADRINAALEPAADTVIVPLPLLKSLRAHIGLVDEGAMGELLIGGSVRDHLIKQVQDLIPVADPASTETFDASPSPR